MRVTLILNRDGVESKMEIGDVYSINIGFGRLYLHTKIPVRKDEALIETRNYLVEEIVDCVLDLKE